MPSFSIPLSGLQSNATSLNTIANNLTNLNTTAYKEVKTTFSDLFYANVGQSGNGDQIAAGEGVQVASNTTDFSQGSYDTSGTTSSDMAIDGNGFFILDNTGSQLYTRNGSFSEDSSGHLVSSDGLSLMGYSATNGVVSTSGSLTDITLPTTGSVMSPSATTSFTLGGNLDSADTTGTSYSSTVAVYDSLGQAHNVTMTYTKTGDNTWSYSASMSIKDFSNYDSTASPAQSDPVIASGSLIFNSNGTLTQVDTGSTTATSGTTVGTATGDISTIALNTSTYTSGTLADGASSISMNWKLLDSSNSPTISQVDSDSSTTSAKANGYASGTYTGFSVDSDGTVNAEYSNGETQAVGQVALANFQNLQGLDKLGSSEYKATNTSGAAAIAVAGAGGMGTIKDSALEDSNVDISTEFANLIVAQRAFEANSKAVTTFDTVTQDTINLIHA